MAFAARCVAYAFAQRQRQRCSFSYTIPQPQRQCCLHPKAASSALGTAPAALLATAAVAYNEMTTMTQLQLQALLQLLQRRLRSFCCNTASETTLRSAVFSFCSSDGNSYSFSDLQLAHLPQPRFQVLLQRHAICASACRQQLQRSTSTALCNQQHPGNTHQQFNVSVLQPFSSSSLSAAAPVLQFQLLATHLHLSCSSSSASKSSNVTYRDISSCKQPLQVHSPSAAKTHHQRQCPHSSISGSAARTTRRSGLSSFGAPATTQQQKLQHLRCCDGIRCEHQMLQPLLDDGSVSFSVRRKLCVGFSSPSSVSIGCCSICSTMAAFSYTASA
jgi:hypothetical protein